MATTMKANPKWWKNDYESGWDRVKAAFKRDWEQTKHDFGGDAPDLNQDVDDTVAQAVGKRPIPPGNAPNFDDVEHDLRFGYAARQHYSGEFRDWNNQLEDRLRNDWGAEDWDLRRQYVRRGWDYGKV